LICQLTDDESSRCVPRGVNEHRSILLSSLRNIAKGEIYCYLINLHFVTWYWCNRSI